MFAVVFAFTLATAYATEIPSYVNVCGRKNPNLSQCILDNVNNWNDKICNGLTDLGVPSLETINIDRLVVSDTANSKIYINDVKITGICDYNIEYFTTDIDKLEFTIGILLNRVYLNGTYDINVHILVPIVHKAPIYLTTDNVKFKTILHVKIVNKNGKDRIYVSQVKTNVEVKGYEAKYGFKDEDLSQLEQILGSFIGSNQEEFVERLLPSLEEAIAKWFIDIFSGVFKMFTFDELFPDRE